MPINTSRQLPLIVRSACVQYKWYKNSIKKYSDNIVQGIYTIGGIVDNYCTNCFGGSMTIKIITDSTSDLPESILQDYDISVVPCFIHADGNSYLDGVEMSREEFYNRLPEWENNPTTSAPSPGMFIDAYQKAIDEGATGIFSIHISDQLSNVVNVARIAAESIQQRFPIQVMDSGQLTMGIGLLAKAAAIFAREGKALEEISQSVMVRAKKIYTYAALDTMEFLKRSGRVSHLGANLGSILQIKPILKMNLGKSGMEVQRTRNNAMKRLIQVAKSFSPLDQVTMVHTNALERARELFGEIKSLLPEGVSPDYTDVSPVIGSHIGPGAVGFVLEAHAE
jgi:DegV family protein with EDD domain